MWADFDAKRRRAIYILEQTKIPRHTYQSLPFKLLWAMHVPLRPLYFYSAPIGGSIVGLFIGVLASSDEWVAVLYAHEPGHSLGGAIAKLIVAFFFFSICFTFVYAHAQNKYKLPEWERLRWVCPPNSSSKRTREKPRAA